jgi:uncharacterized membrane protein YdjX (TVP38/TMEM64 family)
MVAQSTQKAVWVSVAVLCVLGLLGFAVMMLDIPYDALYAFAREHRVYGAVLVGVLMCIATVFAPLAVLPIIPVIAPILGPFTTALASYLGWLVGAIIAFWIAREFGQPIAYRLMKPEHIKTLQKHIDPEISFGTIVMLRVAIPVDALSYALGLFTSVSYRTYTVATAIGIFWFSFAFAYMGNHLVNGQYVQLLGIGVASVAILYFAWRYRKSHTKRI